MKNLRPDLDLRQLAINTIRTLSIDAVQKANSGHPGAPMALAPLAYTLWQDYLNYDPLAPLWMNRDRFVLSAGHASMLLYSLLHLSEVRTDGELAVPMKDIQNFRQVGSKCPGHPEYRLTVGVEATTGPLGQGAANSVGMAISQKWFAAHFNRDGFELFNYRVYTICSDGDMMEGVLNEAASLAGHMKLNNLCWVYDSNKISLEGKTELAFTENVGARFKALGWDVVEIKDANDVDRIGEFFKEVKNATKPTLLVLDSHIGYGAPHKQDTKDAHGEPLGEEEVRLAKKFYGWNAPHDEKFYVPEEVRTLFREGIQARGRKAHLHWTTLFANYREKFPELANQIELIQRGELPKGWDKDLPTFPTDAKGIATRESSAKIENLIASKIPWFMGGSADLNPSTKTNLTFDEACGDFEPGNYKGRNVHFGVREHSMGAIVNGMALSGLRSFGSTFFIFSDYERPAIRLSALMEINTLQIFTHDSIGLGEDGPTHQPIEQLPSLRAIPGLVVFRPADANEVRECWKEMMVLKHQPAAIVLSRQKVPTLDREELRPAEGARRGAYILVEEPNPKVILIATGSEVSLAVEAFEKLKAQKIAARVVSMPSWEIYERQDDAYKEEVLPPGILARVSIEQASTFGWQRYVGNAGIAIGMSTFGASAPLKDLLEKFGFTVDKTVQAAVKLVS